MSDIQMSNQRTDMNHLNATPQRYARMDAPNPFPNWMCAACRSEFVLASSSAKLPTPCATCLANQTHHQQYERKKKRKRKLPQVGPNWQCTGCHRDDVQPASKLLCNGCYRRGLKERHKRQ